MSENACGGADSDTSSNHKYPLLYDEDWLCEKYLNERLSGSAIAEKIGCSNVSVYNALERYGVERRTKTKTYQYPELYDREWLLDQYVEQFKDAKEIASELGCSHHTVHKRISALEIPTRAGGGGNKLETPLSSYGYNLIEGELLGDGGIFKRNENGETAAYQHGTSREKYRDWLAKELDSLGFYTRRTDYKNEDFEAYKLSTRNYYCLAEIKQRWYPCGTKRVPKGFRLTPVSLRQWFIGDGGVSTRASWNRIRLHTEGFDVNSIENLKTALRWIGVKSVIRDAGFLYIPAKYTPRFYDYMAELPNELQDVYGYKWR